MREVWRQEKAVEWLSKAQMTGLKPDFIVTVLLSLRARILAMIIFLRNVDKLHAGIDNTILNRYIRLQTGLPLLV